MAKKVRIEIQLDPEKDEELIQFIDDNGSTRAGFIKFVLRHYMNTIEGNHGADPLPEDIKQEKNNELKVEKKNKKRLPKLGSAFSSNDLE